MTLGVSIRRAGARVVLFTALSNQRQSATFIFILRVGQQGEAARFADPQSLSGDGNTGVFDRHDTTLAWGQEVDLEGLALWHCWLISTLSFKAALESLTDAIARQTEGGEDLAIFLLAEDDGEPLFGCRTRQRENGELFVESELEEELEEELDAAQGDGGGRARPFLTFLR
jgi:hypothetical protein